MYTDKCSCGCENNNANSGCDAYSLPAMAYVPVQKIHCVYELDYGFARGTIFPELDKPWLVEGGCHR